MLCKAQLQDWLEFMMPSLQGGVGDFPPWLRPLHERGHDLTFLGCAAHPKALKTVSPKANRITSHCSTSSWIRPASITATRESDRGGATKGGAGRQGFSALDPGC